MTLSDIATQAMRDGGLWPDFSAAVLQELSHLNLRVPPTLRDLRDRFWISIDNDDSLDLDQLTYAEKDKIFVAIADVDALVALKSAIDTHASHNTTSVYTPTEVFPMLPPQLSNDLSSLNEKSDRVAIVVEIAIGPEGEFTLADLYPCWVRNQAKLTYNGVSSWLDRKGIPPKIEGLLEQIRLQDQLARRVKEYRYRMGALSFGTIEMQPVVQDGRAVDLKQTVHTRANALIENFMIAANVCVTKFLIRNKRPIIKRIVREPQRWDRIVELAKEHGEKLPALPDVKALRDFLLKQRRKDLEHFPDLSISVIKLIGKGEYSVAFPDEPSPGHFDLALHDYAHTTAPNRRFPDLIMQRLLKHVFFGGAMPYDNQTLSALAVHCTQKEDDATKVERRVRKSCAAMVLEPQLGREFAALVTGASDKGTWVRLKDLPVEGKLVKGFEKVDVGHLIHVKLIHVDVAKGYIDFAKI